jgi:5-methylcytosine-specific restriction endonuclease McrA
VIFVDRTRLKINDIQHLIDAANAAQTEISNENDPARRKRLIESHRLKWVAFRTAFETLSHCKCWYTESKNPGTDDDIDHFRPKGRVEEDENHGGYYWMALDWTNFRLSCHRANRLRRAQETGKTHGKSDHFPLQDPSKRARTPTESLAAEAPLILDPCDPFDPPKLTFKSDGTVGVSPKYEDDDFVKKQVEASRNYLHLDWPAFIDGRTELYNRIAFKIRDGSVHAHLYCNGDKGSGVALKGIVTELLDMTREEKPFSAAATAYISIFRAVWWVRDIILKIPPAEGAA